MINQLVLIDVTNNTDNEAAADATPSKVVNKHSRKAATRRAQRVVARAGSIRSWQLDTATCETGKRGVAKARQALRAAQSESLIAESPACDLPAAA